MAGKFLNIWPLKSVARTLAALIIIALGVAIHATRDVPKSFKDDKEWNILRNMDFALCIVSLAFASALLYGSFTGFRLFILSWMIWNVVLTVFWVVFLVRKYTELLEWEKYFRLAAIILMVFSECPVISYFQDLRVVHSDPKSYFSWVEEQSDKMRSVRSNKPPPSSLNSGKHSPNLGKHNDGFETDSDARSVVSIASEEIEENEAGNFEKENENQSGKEGEDGTQEVADKESQSGFECSATVHKTATGAHNGIELENAEGSNNEKGNAEPLFAPDLHPSGTWSEVYNPNILYEETLPGNEELQEYQRMQIAKVDETHVEITSSADITDNEHADKNMLAASENGAMSVTVEIDVTDMASNNVNQTSSF